MTRAFHYNSFIEFSEVSFLLSIKIHRIADMLSDFTDQWHSKIIDLYRCVIPFNNDFMFMSQQSHLMATYLEFYRNHTHLADNRPVLFILLRLVWKVLNQLERGEINADG